MNKIELDSSCMAEIETLLKKIQILDRYPTMKKGLRKGANTFKKQYAAVLPRAGSPADKGHTPLAKSIAVKIIDKNETLIAIIGEKQSDKSHYHAHFVEGGFTTADGKKIPGNPYGQRALAATTGEINSAIIEGVNQAVKNLV